MKAAVTTLALALLQLSSLAVAPASAREVIDCADSLLKPPPGLRVECGKYPIYSEPSGVAHGGLACIEQHYDVRSIAGQPSLFVFARIRGVSASACGVGAPEDVRDDIVSAIKQYTPTAAPFPTFLRDHATNWSDSFKLKHRGKAILFDSTNRDRDGRCVSFYQPSRPRPGERSAPIYRSYYFIRGYACRAPGQALDAATAKALIKSFKVEER